MELVNVEQLIEKYHKAETTLQEEKQLQDYFLNNDVAPHLEHYKPLFTYFSQSQYEAFSKDINLTPKKKRKSIYQWVSVAAVIAIMLSVFILKPKNDYPKSLAQYTKEEQQLYKETKQALAMLSNNFNDGISSLSTLNMASENFEVGIENVQHINQFSKTTDKLLKN